MSWNAAAFGAAVCGTGLLVVVVWLMVELCRSARSQS